MWILIVAILVTVSCSVQTRPPRATAWVVADSFVRLVQARQWAEAAALVDSAFAADIQRATLESYQRLNSRGPTVDEMLASVPDMPRAAAEYEVRRRRREDSLNPPTRALWPGRTFEQPASLDPISFVAIDLQLRDRRSECERLGMPVPDSLYRWEPLGEVLEGDQAFVVVREHRPQRREGPMLLPIDPVGMMRLRRTTAGWRLNDLTWFPGIPAGCR